MNSLKEFCFSSKNILSRLGVSWCRSLDKCQNGIQNTENDTISSCLQTLSYQHSLGNDIVGCHERSILGENLIWRLGNCSSSIGSSASVCQIDPSFCQWFASTGNDSSLRTSWLAKRRRMEKENKRSRTRRTHRAVQHGLGGARLLADGNVSEGGFTTVQPPISQPDTGFLQPGSPEELKVAPLLARSNLLITRNIEWANLMLGFEQENRYAVVDPCYPQGPVGFICEQSNIFARQILRSRRPFIAYITDAMGNELFRVRRPFWWITSSIFAEVDGKEIGVVHRRWHLWRRVYDLYLGTQQFAVVENPGFWNWTFTVKDADGNALAAVDRDWRGFGFELLTDAGQYVIRFGNADPTFKTGPAKLIPDLEISRPLTLAERAIVVALAVSLDNDYFSRHGGFGLPFLVAEE